MKNQKIIPALCLGLFSACAYAQPPGTAPSVITVSYKPNAVIGQDATIWNLRQNADPSSRDCVPTTRPVTTPSSTNYGNDIAGSFNAWTWNGVGCPNGTTRLLFRFPQIDLIPVANPTAPYQYVGGPNGAVINSAILVLRGVPASTPGVYGNNLYPGTPTLTDNDNKGWIKRVLPGHNVIGGPNSWKENLVTWNSQPQVDLTSANWVPIRETNSRFDFDQTFDVTNIIDSICKQVNGYTLPLIPNTPPVLIPPDSFANNGFILELQDETAYRSQFYATSDNPDSDLWPELIVQYTLNYPCNGSFHYTNDPLNPLNFTFSADNDAFLSTGGEYRWITDEYPGVILGTGPTLDYTFLSAGPHRVTLAAKYQVTDDLCTRSVGLIIDPISGSVEQSPSKSMKTNDNLIPSGDDVSYLNHIPEGDDPFSLMDQNSITISPNPTQQNWVTNLNVKEATSVTLIITDLSGNKVIEENKLLKAGNNSFTIQSKGLSAGLYIAEIKGETINYRQKIIKK
jgi:hypothetical protein